MWAHICSFAAEALGFSSLCGIEAGYDSEIICAVRQFPKLGTVVAVAFDQLVGLASFAVPKWLLLRSHCLIRRTGWPFGPLISANAVLAVASPTDATAAIALPSSGSRTASMMSFTDLPISVSTGLRTTTLGPLSPGSATAP